MNLSFRSFFLIFISLIFLFTLIVSGALIFLFRGNEIMQDEISEADRRIEELSFRTEYQLAVVERTMRFILFSRNAMSDEYFGRTIDEAIRYQKLLRAIYVIDGNGKTIAVGAREGRSSLHPDYQGIDFSYTALYNEDVPEGSIIWSDKFISSLTGDTSLGAISRSGDLTIITELSLEGLLTTFDVISSGPDRIWVIDRKGELVIDTGSRDGSAFINVREVPFMKAALRGEAVSEQVRFGNRSYYIRYTRSDQLGWLFLIGIPAGIEHFLVYNTLISLLLMMVTFLVISMIIFPFWTTRLSKDVGFLRDQAVAISNGTAPKEFSRGVVSEFRELSSYMGKMYAKIRGREEDLKLLNQNLEEIVDERTRELSRRNDELNNTLDDLSKMQNILIQSEKLAALGRMVAGVAHELNTPLGNANMAVTSLRDFQHDLQNKLDSGLKRSDLNSYLEHSLHGIDIAERNLNRAAEMVVSFKHVANDQTTSARRKFKLLEVIHDVIITLQPTIKRSPHRVKISNNPDIEMDSFPGVVGQIISNLINNALIHAWPEGGTGKISLSIEAISSPFENTGALEKDWVEIRVADNGKGIPEEYGQRIFDPFFTSRMGSGGTGLGLNIVHNSAENILGGLIRYEEAEGGGTVFILQIPAIAPKMI